MNQPEYILPNGTPVLTHPTLGTTAGMNVASPHLDARRPNAQGTIAGVVGGCGGDVYWVTHEGVEAVGAYCFDEFEMVGREESK